LAQELRTGAGGWAYSRSRVGQRSS
jgi:hypothetical protein